MLETLARSRPKNEQRSRFERMALCHVDALYGTALRLTRNQRDAEDLVQDTLLRAYQGFAQFVGEDSCKAWLFKILTNTFINKYRRRVLERTVTQAMEREGDAGVSTEAVRSCKDPEGALHAGLLSDDVRRALQDLPEEFRLAVVLCDLEEFSYREISDIMDCPVGTVMSRLYRGRQLLKTALREYAEREGIVKGPDTKIDAKVDSNVIPLRRPLTSGSSGGGESR